MNASHVIAFAIALCGIVFLLYVLSQCREKKRRLAPYLLRPERLNEWTEYGDGQTTQEFKDVICECLQLPHELASRLQPDDRLMSLYNCVLNVDPSANDGLDFAEAILTLEGRFGGTFPAESQPLHMTLGELFRLCVLAPADSGNLMSVLRRG